MKKPRYSRVYTISLIFTELMVTLGVVAFFGDDKSSHLQQLVTFTVGILAGSFFIGQIIKKGSVFVLAWEVKGSDAILIAIFSGLLLLVSAYCLIETILKS